MKADIQALRPRPLFTAFKQGAHVVRRRNLATTTRSGECRVAVAGGDVQHALVAQQVAGFSQLLADNLQSGTDYRIVAAGPRGHLAVFQGSQINGCAHGDDLCVET
ncbi:hypothetical protein D3C76_1491580 [compost metagenome]